MPEYPGGQDQMVQFIQQNVQYPEISRENEVEGKVYIRFVVDIEGSLTDIKILKGVDEHIDAEALRVVQAMPKWSPGTQKGKPVRVTFTLPINFKLD